MIYNLNVHSLNMLFFRQMPFWEALESKIVTEPHIRPNLGFELITNYWETCRYDVLIRNSQSNVEGNAVFIDVFYSFVLFG